MIKIYVKKTTDDFQKPLNVEKIEYELLKGLVEGDIEYIYDRHFDGTGICMVVNEEGKLHKLKPNIMVHNGSDVVVGNIVFYKENESQQLIEFTREDELMIVNYILDNKIRGFKRVNVEEHLLVGFGYNQSDFE